MLEPITVIAGLEDVAMMGASIQEGVGELGIAEHVDHFSAEGGGGSVITCMHAGVIPVASFEASVDIKGNGVILTECSYSEIHKAVARLSDLLGSELEAMTQQTWQFASSANSKESFVQKYREFVLNVLL